MQKLPISFKKYFWDCEFDQLELPIHREFILKRLMNYGNMEGIQYILSEVALEEVRNLMQKRGPNILTKTNYLFWNRLVKHAELWNKKYTLPSP